MVASPSLTSHLVELGDGGVGLLEGEAEVAALGCALALDGAEAMRRGSAVEYLDPRRDPHLNACTVCWPDLVCVVQ
jgi:hypothetical protein